MIDASFLANSNEIKNKLQDMYASIADITNFKLLIKKVSLSLWINSQS